MGAVRRASLWGRCIPLESLRAASLVSFAVQALESAEKKRQERKQEQEDNLAEITNLLRGDLLSEDPQQAASSFGPHRVVPDRWKGMTQEQLEQIRLVQKQQVQEKLVPAHPHPRAPRRSSGLPAAALSI